ncbi:MAG: protein meaA [Acidimicrobiales bacterium]
MADQPWVMRTYSGHSSAAASNELYRKNIAKGQTGLSIAFDLPTQLGYDPDAPQAAGEVGKVGVPIAHLGHMAQLLEGIALDKMNTSMTINATAPWLLGCYVANAQAQGVEPAALTGTTQNDLVKEYLSRGTYIFPPAASLRCTVDLITYALRHVPRWNPINVCSYHLQEAGATPVQEVAYALATAIAVLDAVRDCGQVAKAEMPQVVGRISFFVNAGLRFVEETCKMRAFSKMWEHICKTRYDVQDPKLRRFRYGVQVNSLGLTEQQPENNIQRIVLEMLGVTLSRDARARAIQLPAWNEALGLPRPFDQQWSLRIQQVLAFESDILEYEDLLEGSKVVADKTAEIVAAATSELDDVLERGGAFAAIDELKARLVASQAERLRRIESGEQLVVGVNCFTESEPSLLHRTGEDETSILTVDPATERALGRDLAAWRKSRDSASVRTALDELQRAGETGENLMPATVTLAQVGGTTGEWAGTLRSIFGDYRAPTGVRGGIGRRGGELRAAASAVRAIPGHPPRLLVAKPGLDGHSNGAEQIAVAARDAGFEVVYNGIRSSPAEIAAVALDEDVDVVGISILSGSHLELVPEILAQLASRDLDVPVVVGGIIPAGDQPKLLQAGVAAIYTPKDFRVGQMLTEIAALAAGHRTGSRASARGRGPI